MYERLHIFGRTREEANMSMLSKQSPCVARRWAPRLLLALVTVGAGACDDDGPPARTLAPGLVSAEWLAERLDEPGLVIVDARPTAEYLAGHIPGAISASFPEDEATSNGRPISYGGGVDIFGDEESSVPFQDGSPEQIQEAVRSLGIDPDSRVIVYDTGPDFDASRFLFTLAHHGFDGASILDGGFGFWTSEGRPTDTVIPEVTRGSFVAKAPDPTLVATTDDVLAALADPNVYVVTGLEPSWHYGQYLAYSEAGHIPQAVPIPLAYYFDADGRFRSVEQLEALFEVSGVETDSEIITYCGGNPLSACTWFTLRYVMGHKRVRNYTGSLVAWLADARDLPVDTYQHPAMLRDTNWIHWWAGERIQTLLLDAPAQVIDVRSSSDHDAAHMPWSVSIPVGDVATTSADVWASTFADTGIGTEREVVVCDQRITPEMTAMFWLLEYLGHTRVSVCADGLRGWTAAGYALTDEPTLVTAPNQRLDVAIHPTRFDVALREDRRLRTPDGAPIQAAFPRLWLVASESIPEVAAEMDTIAHVPWTENLTATGYLKSAAELWKLYEASGVSLFEEVVCTADSWQEASVAYFALRTLGVPMVRVYLPNGTEL
jgi:thiosulfate/3-mercaptopyruvate sulfurtransferase